MRHGNFGARMKLPLVKGQTLDLVLLEPRRGGWKDSEIRQGTSGHTVSVVFGQLSIIVTALSAP